MDIKTGIAQTQDRIQSTTIIFRALDRPETLRKQIGWQIAKYLSVEKATTVKTDAYVALKMQIVRVRKN